MILQIPNGVNPAMNLFASAEHICQVIHRLTQQNQKLVRHLTQDENQIRVGVLKFGSFGEIGEKQIN